MIALFKKIQARKLRILPGGHPAPVFREFQSAADETLGCLRSIITGTHGLDQPRIDLLKELGFTSCRNVASWERMHALLLKETGKLARVRHYNTRYPDYKFVLFTQLDEICKRYSYLCIPVTLYKGNVPEEAVMEMTSFNVDNEDVWFSNYAHNIIEFNESNNVVRKPLSEISSPVAASLAGLEKLPLYICTASACHLDESGHGTKHEQAQNECIVLHPVPYGFLLVTNWVTDISTLKRCA